MDNSVPNQPEGPTTESPELGEQVEQSAEDTQNFLRDDAPEAKERFSGLKKAMASTTSLVKDITPKMSGGDKALTVVATAVILGSVGIFHDSGDDKKRRSSKRDAVDLKELVFKHSSSSKSLALILDSDESKQAVSEVLKVANITLSPGDARLYDAQDLYQDNGYRAVPDIQDTLDAIYKMEGRQHRKLDMKSGKLPGLLDELDGALGKGKRTDFAQKLDRAFTTEQLERAREYIADVVDEKKRNIVFVDDPEVMATLDTIYKMEGRQHRKLDVKTGRFPGLLDELDGALGKGQRTDFAQKLDRAFTTKHLEGAREYIADVIEKNKDLRHRDLSSVPRGVSAGNTYKASRTLETAGQVETGRAVNPLTPPSNNYYHSIRGFRAGSQEMQAKVEYNLRNYVNEDKKLNHANNNWATEVAIMESRLNPYSANSKGKMRGNILLFQMGDAERKRHGGGTPGDWHGQRRAAEKLAVWNMEEILKKVSGQDIDNKKITFSGGVVMNPDDSSIAGGAWLSGPGGMIDALKSHKTENHRVVSGRADSNKTLQFVWMINSLGHKVNFREQARESLKRKGKEEAQPVRNDRQSMTLPELPKDSAHYAQVSFGEGEPFTVNLSRPSVQEVLSEQPKLESESNKLSNSWVSRLDQEKKDISSTQVKS